MKELVDSRAKQAQDKHERLQREKEQEKLELVHQLEYARRLGDREEREATLRAQKVKDLRNSLQIQIEEIERLRSRQRSGVDGPNIREELIREEEKLKVIRDRMVRELEAQGVNPKYLTEMKHVDIGKILKR